MKLLLSGLQIRRVFPGVFATYVLFGATLVTYSAAPQELPKDDPVLRAMQTELEREQAQLVLPGMQRPYFIEYRVDDFSHLRGGGQLWRAGARGGGPPEDCAGHGADRQLHDGLQQQPRRRHGDAGADGRQSRGHPLLPVDRDRRGVQKRPARVHGQAGRAEALPDSADREGFCSGQGGAIHRPAGSRSTSIARSGSGASWRPAASTPATRRSAPMQRMCSIRPPACAAWR